MKVILTKNVPKIGSQYDVVEVKSGFANNFLFPQGLAELATDAKVADLEKKKEELKAELEAVKKKMKEKFEKIGKSTVTIKTKADETGSLYKKIQIADVVEAIKNKLEVDIPESGISLEEPIATIGEVEVEIEAFDTKANITLSVEKED